MENIRIVPLKNIMKELTENVFDTISASSHINDDIDILILDSILNNKILPTIIFDDNKDKKTLIKGSYILECINRCLYSEETDYFYDIFNDIIIHHNTMDLKTNIPLNIFLNSIQTRFYIRKFFKHIDEDHKCFDNIDRIGRNIYGYNLIVIDNSTKDNTKQYTEISNYLK